MKKLFSEHKPEIVSASVAIVAITCFAFLPAFRGWKIDSTNAGQFGDFVGGYFGTVFLIISVAILVGSYRNQRATTERAAFENRFFELLKFHRENLTEIGIGERTGRRVFVSLIREFREVLELVRQECHQSQPAITNTDLIDFAYRAFYYGVGQNSSRILRAALLPDYNSDLIDRVIKNMEEVQREYYSVSALLQDASASENIQSEAKKKLKTLTQLSYCPFDGHQSRLGHYYRHLYHTVRYAADRAPSGNAGEYVDVLRAQLTNHEQALFCLNALSKVGSAWIELGYMDRFELVKNLPKNFFDPVAELDVTKQFPNIKFEYLKTEGKSREPNTDDFDYGSQK